MENHEFDQLARECVGAPTRRTLVRGLAAVLGVSGLSLVLGDETEAAKRQNKRQQRRDSKNRKDDRKKKEEKRKKKREEKKHECGSNGKVCSASTNPCQTVACEDHKCITSNVANGTACGNGLACNAGQCVCPGGTCLVEVTPANLGAWGFFDEAANQPIAATMVSGPGDPPYGNGSASLKINSNPEKTTVGARILNGVKLADLNELSYRTFVQSAAGDTAPSFQIGITRDIENPLNGFESRLVFVPSVAAQVVKGEWQEWDLMDSVGNLPAFRLGKGTHPNVPHCSGSGTDWCTFAQVIEHYPNIAINPIGPSPDNPGTGWGFIGAMVGSGEGAVDAYVDGITVAVKGTGTRTIYNFEPSS